ISFRIRARTAPPSRLSSAKRSASSCSSPDSGPGRDVVTRLRVTLFLLLFASYAYFYQAGGWNQHSRFNLVRAIVNDGSFGVDPYNRSTGDQAVFDGHYFSDKAPGLSFAALPSVLVGRAIYRALGGDAESYEGIAWMSWVATVFTAGLFTALAAVA